MVNRQVKRGSTWKFQMKHLLLAKGLWGVVDGSEALTESTSEEIAAQFCSKSQRAFLTIVLAIKNFAKPVRVLNVALLVIFVEIALRKNRRDILSQHMEQKSESPKASERPKALTAKPKVFHVYSPYPKEM